MTLVLRVENETSLPNGAPTTMRVPEGRNVDIGRGAHLDWTLPDPSRFISGKHCEVRFRDGAFWLYDVSTNGTFLNESSRRLQAPHRLVDGDRLTIGSYVIAVALEAAPPVHVDGEVAAASPDAAPEAAPALAEPPVQAAASALAEAPADIAAPPDAAAPPALSLAEQFAARSQEPFDAPAEAPVEPPVPQWGEPEDAPVAAPVAELAPPAEPLEVVDAPMPPPVALPDAPMPPVAAFETPLPDPVVEPEPMPVAPPAPPPEPVFAAPPPAPPRPAPAPTMDAAPAEARAPATVDEFIARFAKGAEIPENIFARQDGLKVAEEMGALMRLIAENVTQLLAARFKAKRFARTSNQTMIQALDNNPLKFAPTPEDALRIMFGPRTSGYLDARRALDAAFKDLKTHQVKTFSAMQGAVNMLVEDLDPGEIDGALGDSKSMLDVLGGRKARLWDLYQARWQAKTLRHEDGLTDAFMLYFAECYDRSDDTA
jgi:type VI secretion system protein ImpI